jgi:hypothetical protein
MATLNDVETAALHAIAANYPDFEPQIASMFESCVVTKRENTGGGFFTTLALQTQVFSPIGLRSPLGDGWLSIKGLRFGICCLVFLTEGFPTLLEGYAVGPEDTSEIDFGTVAFKVRDAPPTGEDDAFKDPN